MKIVHQHRTILIKLSGKIVFCFLRIGNLYLARVKSPRPLSLYSLTLPRHKIDWHLLLGHPSDEYLRRSKIYLELPPHSFTAIEGVNSGLPILRPSYNLEGLYSSKHQPTHHKQMAWPSGLTKPFSQRSAASLPSPPSQSHTGTKQPATRPPSSISSPQNRSSGCPQPIYLLLTIAPSRQLGILPS